MVGEMGVAMKLQGVEIVKVDEFEYLGSTIQSNRGEEEWGGWRQVSEVICDKSKREGLQDGSETCWDVCTKRQEAELKTDQNGQE